MEPAKLIAETFENGCHNEFTTFGFRFSQWEEKARQVLSANSYGYVKGSAGDGYTDNQAVSYTHLTLPTIYSV